MSRLMEKAAQGLGSRLFSLAQGAGKGLIRGGEHLSNTLGSQPVRAVGEALGEGVGRLTGALEGMGADSSAELRSKILENRALQGKELGRDVAPVAAGALGALGLGYLGKKLVLGDKGPHSLEQYELYPDRYEYPDYTNY